MNKRKIEPSSRHSKNDSSGDRHNGANQHRDEISHKILSFNDNKIASLIFGKFDEHLALIEQMLGIEAIARGNEVTLSGHGFDIQRAETALHSLQSQIIDGQPIGLGDVEGAIRMSEMSNKSNSEQPDKGGQPNDNAKIVTHKKVVNARTPMQAEYIRAIKNSKLVFGVGPAGTGKTYLAVAHAASLLEKGAIDRIILTRPAVEAGENLGFLPGDMKEKVDPYLRPLYDALYDMMAGEKVERAIETGEIEIAPLAFMRGRTLANAAIILDEAQNTTTMQMKMFLTRLGENSCMIITGDPSQIDLPHGQKSGLVDALTILKSVNEIKQIHFSAKDVVRHSLVAKIVVAYDNFQMRKTQSGSRIDLDSDLDSGKSSEKPQETSRA